MAFFTYSQNNSGGVWREPAQYVIIEADNEYEANEIAESEGLYFNGVREGVDCECCGDRWCKQWKEEGDAVPTIYNYTDLSSYDHVVVYKKS